MKNSPEELLRHFERSHRGLTPKHAVELLEAYGFEFTDSLKGGNRRFNNIADPAISVIVPVGGNNLNVEARKLIIAACASVTPPQQLHPAAELREFVEAIFIAEAPELRYYLKFSADDTEEQKSARVNAAIEDLQLLVIEHNEILQNNLDNYGIKFIRDTRSQVLMLSAPHCNIQKSIKYKEANPIEIQSFVLDIQSQVEEILMKRFDLLEKYKAAGGRVKEDDQTFTICGPSAHDKPQSVAKFGKAGFLTVEAEHSISAAITKIQKDKEALANQSFAEKNPPRISPLADGPVELQPPPRDQILSRRADTKSMHLPQSVVEAKQRIYDTIEAATNLTSPAELLKYAADKTGVRPNIADQFFNPEHRIRPQIISPHDLKGFRERFAQFLTTEFQHNAPNMPKREVRQAIDDAIADFKVVQNARSKNVNEEVQPVAKTILKTR